MKLQMVGLAAGHDKIVLRGDVATRKFSAFHYRSDMLLAVDSINRPEDYMPARKLLDQGTSPSFAQVAGLSAPLTAR